MKDLPWTGYDGLRSMSRLESQGKKTKNNSFDYISRIYHLRQ
jgi:hypothetical protein